MICLLSLFERGRKVPRLPRLCSAMAGGWENLTRWHMENIAPLLRKLQRTATANLGTKMFPTIMLLKNKPSGRNQQLWIWGGAVPRGSGACRGAGPARPLGALVAQIATRYLVLQFSVPVSYRQQWHMKNKH